MRNRKLLHKNIKLAVLTLAIVSALAFFSLALAQSANLFDLGCWGVTTAGGGARGSTTARLRDSLGQAAVGNASSASAILRGGYIQNWAQASPTPMPTSQPLTGDNLVFLSSVWSYVKSARVCS